MTISPTRAADTTADGPSSPAAAAPQAEDSNTMVSQDTFLQLLVAQIKNQNPLDPTDGTQFLSQLAQFSQLEQLIAVREDLDKMTQFISPSAQ